MSEQQTWTEEEIKDLIIFAQQVRLENEELQAKIIAMDAYVRNADAKNRQLELTIKQFIYGQGNNPYNSN
jgi:hypothetical protein